MRPAASLTILTLTLACGATRPSGDRGAAERKKMQRCQRSQKAIFGQIERSQRKRCERDGDCALVLSPSNPGAGFRHVVHGDDAARIGRLSQQQLRRCGAVRQSTLSMVRVVKARCVGSRCREQATTLHIDDE